MTGDQLRDARMSLGLSLHGMADRLRMGSRGADHLREMETGRRPVTGPIETAVELMLKETGE